MGVRYYYGSDYDYANRRLNNTFVKTLDGTPVLLKDFDISGKFNAILLDKNERIEVKLEEIDMEPLRIGYINQGSYADFGMRMPVRGEYRQGLSAGNFRTKLGQGLGDFSREALYKTFLCKYPTLEESVKATVGKKRSTAFSRDFAVNCGNKIEYHCRIVGAIQDGVPVLKPEHFYLTEHLQQSLGK